MLTTLYALACMFVGYRIAAAVHALREERTRRALVAMFNRIKAEAENESHNERTED